MSLRDKKFADVYFCGDEDDGHAKKNKWFKTWRPSEYDAEDDDNDQYWYSIDKNGKVYIPSQSNASKLAYGVKYKLKDAKLEAQNSGATIEFTKKNVNSKSYFFNQDGEMLSQFIEVSADNLGADSGLKAGMYYFGGDDDGSMKTGSQTVKDNTGDSYKFYFYTKDQAASYKTPDGKHGLSKGAGVVGNQGNKLYWYGLPIQADDYKYQLATITDENGVEHTFIVNKNGSIQKNRVDYKEDKAESFAFLGHLYYENEEYLKAIRYFEKALDINPDVAFVHFLLGNAYSRAGKIMEAITSYDFAIFLDLDIYKAHIDFAEKYEKMGLLDRALKEYVIAYEIDPREKNIGEKIKKLKEKLEVKVV